ncbi:MAG: hypothetical protein LBV00_00840 [Propionibacteriaceae bacterium]|nr:hypothetical protein [Propionibacteriaceae bacterium]
MTSLMKKVVPVERVLDLIQDGDILVNGMGGNEPVGLLSRLHEVADRVHNVTVVDCLPLFPGEYLQRDSFRVESWFYTPQLRALEGTGRVSYVPNHIDRAGIKFNARHQAAMLCSMASAPGPDGLVRFATGNAYEERIAEKAKYRVLEISERAPWCHGNNFLDPDAVDFIIESDAELSCFVAPPPTDNDMVIGRIVADLIKDGDCLQIGIGGIPDAICLSLRDKKDLGVHTEMLTVGIMDLIKAGVVTNARKQIDIGKSTFIFGCGSPDLYSFMHENSSLWTGCAEELNSPFVIAQNDNQVSINSTIEIDLTGQCSSESVGTRHVSGAGGQAETAAGAQLSKNGRSIIALHSTQNVRDRATGEVSAVSKIVPTLRPGAAVTLSRADVDWVVTEHGSVWLRGTSLAERARLLISVAHPAHREELTQAARRFGYFL